MKKQLETHRNIKDDLFYWLKEYISSKVLTSKIDDGYKGEINRSIRSQAVKDAKHIKELMLITIDFRNRGQSDLRNSTLPNKYFYDYIVGSKNLKSIKDIDTTVRDKYFSLNPKNHAKSTQNLHMVAVNSFFKYIEENNTDDFRFNLGRKRGGQKTVSPIVASGEKKSAYLNTYDLRYFLKQLELFSFKMKNTSKPKLMTKILIFGGLRGTELLKIRRGDISLVDNLGSVTKSKSKALKGKFFRIYVQGKGNKERVVYIAAKHIKEDYDNYLKDSEECINNLFFCTEGNKKYSINALYQQCNRLLSKLGMTEQGQKGSQILRHSYAAYLALKNVDLADISTLLGHASQDVTELYIHISKEDLRDVDDIWKDI
ncbi:MAG: Unknown protein [uncultured Sulfurovum sp.]|uniref:Tyr recombinase domain-containing protein n=1 Tax=uncultured Sulfurovum sp. TaxID=269237 RepID=A0A6S6SVU7_9BACT|nr:MAG: Unknown protein [uncultured Sulfurovum sp.]